MNFELLDIQTAWILKGILEASSSVIDMHSAKVVARWFGQDIWHQRCPYGELGWQFEDLVIEAFSEEFVEKWHRWYYISYIQLR